MLFQRRQPLNFSAFGASCRWLQANSLVFVETLQICTRWTTTHGTPCCKSKIKPSRSLIRPLMSWKSPGRLPGKSCHKNTSTKRWRTSPSVWLSTCMLWSPTVVRLGICSNSVNLQVCILISPPTKWLFREQPTSYWLRQRSECWEMGGCVLVEHNFVIFRYISTKLGDKVYVIV